MSPRRAAPPFVLVLGLATSLASCGTVAARPGGPAAVDLELTASPATWPAGALQDVIFELALVNRAGGPVRVYPKTAVIAGIAGWDGPTYGFSFRPKGGGAAIEHRQHVGSVQGPPGTPPPASYHEDGAVDLARGQRQAWTIAACWIPISQLTEQKTAAPDRTPFSPEPPPAGASVLVLRTKCQQVLDARRDHRNPLDGEVVAFLAGPDSYAVNAFYAQHGQSGFFAPKQPLHAVSPAIEVAAGGP